MNLVYPPHLGVNDDSCKIIHWVVDDESHVETGAIICEVETTKAVYDVEVTHTGYLKQLVKVEDEIAIDKPVAVILQSLDEKYEIEDDKKDDDLKEKEFEKLNCTKKAYEYAIINNVNLGALRQENIITLEQVKQVKQSGTVGDSHLQRKQYRERYARKKIAIYGTGLGAETAYYHVQVNSSYDVKYFINDFDKAEIHGINSVTFDQLLEQHEGLHGIACFTADNAFRLSVLEKIKDTTLSPVSIISKKSNIATSAIVGHGVFIKDGVVIGNDCIIGDGVVIDDNVTVPHHCIIEDGAFLAPGCSLGGGCIIRSKVVVGVGASIASNLVVGENAIISSGAAVLTNVDNNVVIQGNPGIAIGKKNK